MRQKITFYSEDFSQPIADLIPPEMSDCIVFRPEILWGCDRPQVEFLFHAFLRNAKMHKNKQLDGTYKGALDGYRNIIDLLVIRSPAAKNLLSKIATQIFLLIIPLANEDTLTISLLPLVAGIFWAILQLSAELADPWGEDDHDLPLKEVMTMLAAPVWFQGDRDKAKDSLAWLNKGLTDNIWEHPGHKAAAGLRESISMIPRTKKRGEDKGLEVNFDDFRTLPDILGQNTWDDLVNYLNKDMDAAKARKRRMPDYLRGVKF